MSTPHDGQPPVEDADNAAEASGSIVERAKGTPTEGNRPEEEARREGQEAIHHRRPTRMGKPLGEIDEASFDAGQRDTLGAPAGPVDLSPPREEDLDPKAARKAELKVAACFLTTAAASLAFAIWFFVGEDDYGQDGYEYYSPVLGGLLAVALFALGAGMVLWAKKLMPHGETVQERHDWISTDADREATSAALIKGFEETQLPRRKLLLGGTLGIGTLTHAIPALVPLIDLGPLPKRELYTTQFKKGVRLVRRDGSPVRLGELAIGGIETVFPEGHTESADAVTLLIRLSPGQNEPRPGRENWAVADHIAYSKICTHAGCPASLYEQQTNHLLCPCHQSVFDVVDGARPIFGPAARSLPQLPIELDENDFFVAQSDYREPIGPSFWERG